MPDILEKLGALGQLAREARLDAQRRRYLANRLAFGHDVLGYRDLRPYPHGEILELLDSPGKPYKHIEMPRNSFKTSLITITAAMHEALLAPDIRVLIGSETYESAKKYMRPVKAHCEDNRRFRELFGKMGFKGGPHTWNDDELIWSSRQNTALQEATFTATGIDSPRTGKHYDLIILDDLHSERNTRSIEQIQQVIEFIQLSYSLLAPGGRLWVIGTRWAMFDSYAWIMEEQKELYDVYIKSAYEPEGSPHGPLLLPEVLSEEFLDIKRKGQTPYQFSCQYLNNPIADDAATFKARDARFWDYDAQGRMVRCGINGVTPELIPGPLNICMTIDPAISEGSNSCDFAIVVEGRDKEWNDYMLDKYAMRGQPNDAINSIFELYLKWHPIMVGIEMVAFQRFLKYYLEQEMRRRGVFIPIVELKGWTDASKDERIRGREPKWRNHAIWLRKGDSYSFTQFLEFPKGRRKDILDCDAYMDEIQITPTVTRSATEERYKIQVAAGLTPAQIDLYNRHDPELAREQERWERDKWDYLQ